MAGDSRRYEVEIPATIRDDTAEGARRVSTSLDKIAERSRLAGAAHYRLMHQLADRDAREQEANARRILAEQEKRYKEEQKLRREAAAEDAKNAREQQRAAARALADAQRVAREQERAAARRLALNRQLEREEVNASNRRRAWAERRAREEESAHNRRIAQIEREARAEDTVQRSRASRLRQAGMGARNIGVGLVTAGAVLTGAVTAPVIGGIQRAIEDASKLDAYQRALVAITGSADVASKKLAELYTLSRQPGLTLEGAVRGQIRLQEFGLSSQFATRMLAALGNAVALTGDTTEKQQSKLQTAIDALGMITTRSKLSAQGLRALIAASPEIAEAIRRAFGTTDPKAINGHVKNTQEFVERVVAQLEKLPRATTGIAQQITNFGGLLEHEFARIGMRVWPLIEQVLSWLSDRIPKAIDYLTGLFDDLSPTGQKVVVALVAIATAAGPLLTALGFIIISVGGFIAGVGALASAVGSVGAIFTALAAIVLGLSEAIAVVTAVGSAFYLAWTHDIGHMQEIVATAIGLIQGTFVIFVRLVKDEWTDLWPTLESLAEKAIGAIIAAWEAVAPFILAGLQTLTRYGLPLLYIFLDTVLKVVETIARIADGDWKGAWESYTLVLFNVFRRWEEFVNETIRTLGKKILIWAVQADAAFQNAALHLAVNLIVGFASALESMKEKLSLVLAIALVEAASTLDLSNIGGILAIKLFNAIRGAVREGEEEASRRANRPGPAAPPEGSALYKEHIAQPQSNFLNPPTEGAEGKTVDPAIEKLRILQDELATVDKKSQATLANLDRLYKFNIIGVVTYSQEVIDEETKRFAKVNAILDQEYAVAQTKRKAAAAAVADVEKRRAEEQVKHEQIVAHNEDAYLQERLQRYEAGVEHLLTIQEAGDQRAIVQLRKNADLRLLSHEEAERQIDAVERRGFDRADAYLREQQNLFATDSQKFLDLANKRAVAAEHEADRRVAAQDRIIAAMRRDSEEMEQFDAKISQVDRANLQTIAETNKARIDQLEKLGANPDFIRAQRTLTAAYDNYEEQRRSLIEEKVRAMANATTDERTQIESVYHERAILLEEQHQVRMGDIMVAAMERYAAKIGQIAGEVGDAFGNAFASIFEKGRSFWAELGNGFRQLWMQIVRDFIASRVKQYIESLFNPVFRATSSGGAGGGVSLGSLLLGGVSGGGFGGGGALTGGFAGGNPALSLLMGGGGGLATPTSISAGALSNLSPDLRRQLSLAALDMPDGGGSAGGGVLGGLRGLLGGGRGLGGLIGGMAPLLGLGFGMGLGGGSGLGRVFGGVGGALGGLLASGLLAGGGLSLVGGTAGSLLGFLGIGGGLLGAATLGIGAAVAVVGALLAGRNAARRKAETQRNAISNDTGTAIWALITQAKSPQGLSVAEATQRWKEIETNYFNQIGQLKDSKTRHNAEKQWEEDFKPLWKILLQNAQESDRRANIRALMSPVFAGGGTSTISQLIRVRPGEGVRYPGRPDVSMVPGVDRGYDTQYMYAPAGTHVYTRSEMNRSPGYAGGGTVGASSEKRPLVIDPIIIEEDENGQMSALLSGPEFEARIVQVVRRLRKKRKLD